LEKNIHTLTPGIRNGQSTSVHYSKGKESLEERYNSVIMGKSKTEIEHRLESLMKLIKAD
jgi:hypothetical protein